MTDGPAGEAPDRANEPGALGEPAFQLLHDNAPDSITKEAPETYGDLQWCYKHICILVYEYMPKHQQMHPSGVLIQQPAL